MTQSPRRVRDSQRIRVYRANSAVLGTPLPHMDDVRDFAENVVSSALWQAMFPEPDRWRVPTLKPGRGARTAHVLWHEDGRIEAVFPKMYRYATYVLHELTHFGIGYRDDIAAHGPEFTGMFMMLVREFCNKRTSDALEKNFAREKVRMFVPIIDLRAAEDREPLYVYDEDTNTVIINGPVNHIDIEQLTFKIE